MRSENNNIISGPVDDILIPEGSIGKYFLECMKKEDPNHISAIDHLTNKHLTNGQILQYSLRAAGIFKDFGIKKGDVVTIIVENTLKYCIAELGALFVGAVVNLLNPGYSIGETKHALALTQPKLILCSDISISNIAQVYKDLEMKNTKILLLENKTDNHIGLINFESLLETVPFVDPDTFEPEEINGSEDGAFILMSSGTTGLPKGVLLTHDNLRAYCSILSYKEYFGVSNKDTTIFVLPFFHVFGVIIQMLSVTLGLKVVILNKFKPDIFLDSIEKHKPTKLYLAPPTLLFLSKSPLVDKYDISSVKDIVVGGAPVGKELQDSIIKKISGVTVRQIYGLTEVTGGCTLHTFHKLKLNTVGVLVPHMHGKVWDVERKQNLGPRKVGELCFKGATVMKGYYKNQNVTNQSIDEEGFYHSGDVGYYDEEGFIYVIDRCKELIKFKGFQVPPAEVEALVLTHPAVKDCAVIGIPDERAGEVAMAYVVRQNNSSVKEQNIVDYVAANISIPKQLHGGVIFTEEIPKTPSGKILRRKLTERFHSS